MRVLTTAQYSLKCLILGIPTVANNRSLEGPLPVFSLSCSKKGLITWGDVWLYLLGLWFEPFPCFRVANNFFIHVHLTKFSVAWYVLVTTRLPGGMLWIYKQEHEGEAPEWGGVLINPSAYKSTTSGLGVLCRWFARRLQSSCIIRQCCLVLAWLLFTACQSLADIALLLELLLCLGLRKICSA